MPGLSAWAGYQRPISDAPAASLPAPPEDSAKSEQFNYTPGAILPINEDERLETSRPGDRQQAAERVPMRGDVLPRKSSAASERRK